MGMPTIEVLPPTFDDTINAHLRVLVVNDGGGGCTVDFYYWDELFKPGKWIHTGSYPGKTTGQIVAHTQACMGFKYQQRMYATLTNGVDVATSPELPYWPLLDRKFNDGQPWKINAAVTSWSANVMTFSVVTDIMCHLWLCWSDHEPFIRSRAHQKRGTVMWHDGEHGLVVNGTVEQQETGDTLVHHLPLTFPLTGGERWWFLIGEVNERVSKSRTPFFHAVYVPPAYTPMVYNNGTGVAGFIQTQFFQYSVGILPTQTFDATRLAGWFASHLTNPHVEVLQLHIWSVDSLYKPIAALSSSAYVPVDLPHVYEWTKVSATIPRVTLTAGVKYAFVWNGNFLLPRDPMQYYFTEQGAGGVGVPDTRLTVYLRQYFRGSWNAWTRQTDHPAHIDICRST